MSEWYKRPSRAWCIEFVGLASRRRPTGREKRSVDGRPASRGQASDIAIHAREILKARETLNGVYARHTGQSVEKIAHDTERDNFMSADEAKAYGIVDVVIR